jgi:hypothetical protein
MKQALKVYHELLNEKRKLSYSKKRDHEWKRGLLAKAYMFYYSPGV